jgi:hypothetical protein
VAQHATKLCGVSSAKRLWLVGPRTAATSKMNPQNVDVLDHLRQLAALREAGTVTQAEYDAKKAELRALL